MKRWSIQLKLPSILRIRVGSTGSARRCLFMAPQLPEVGWQWPSRLILQRGEARQIPLKYQWIELTTRLILQRAWKASSRIPGYGCARHTPDGKPDRNAYSRHGPATTPASNSAGQRPLPDWLQAIACAMRFSACADTPLCGRPSDVCSVDRDKTDNRNRGSGPFRDS